MKKMNLFAISILTAALFGCGGKKSDNASSCTPNATMTFSSTDINRTSGLSNDNKITIYEKDNIRSETSGSVTLKSNSKTFWFPDNEHDHDAEEADAKDSVLDFANNRLYVEDMNLGISPNEGLSKKMNKTVYSLDGDEFRSKGLAVLNSEGDSEFKVCSINSIEGYVAPDLEAKTAEISIKASFEVQFGAEMIRKMEQE